MTLKKVWTLRKAGLGLLSNLPGDEKAVPVIEDTAVDVHDLPDYIRDFNLILEKVWLVFCSLCTCGIRGIAFAANLKLENRGRK
jgi:hypothetical protein